MIWRRRLIGSAVAVLLLLIAASFFGGAITISRLNSLVAKSDASLEAQGNITRWRSFYKYPVNPWLVELSGYGEYLELRKAYVLLADKETAQEGVTLLRKLTESGDKKLASLALTWLGNITFGQALANEDGRMFEVARQMFARAAVLDPGNEDAKYNLELLNALRNALGGIDNSTSEDGESEKIKKTLPIDELPGSEGGQPGDYSGY